MPADGKVNGKYLVDGDVILVQLVHGTHIPAARASAGGVIPAVVVAVEPTRNSYGQARRRVTVRLYTLGGGDALTLTGSVADVNVGVSQTFWYADHFRTWRDRGVPRSVNAETGSINV